MTPAELISGIEAARYIIEGLVRQAELARRDGKITDEELANVKARAQATDSRWDAIAAAAREREQQ